MLRPLDEGDLDTLGALLRSPGGVGVSLDFLRWEYRDRSEHIDEAIATLRAHGCDIDTSQPGTARLLHTHPAVWGEYLRRELAALGNPRHVEVYARLASTQDAARRRAGEGVLVMADEQTSGRGRHGRRWHTRPGEAVLMSFNAAMDSTGPEPLSITAAVTIAEVTERLTGRRPGSVSIKPPNDVLVDGRKLAGILIETLAPVGGGRVAIVGVGVNVDPPPPVEGAGLPPTSLAELGSGYDRLHIAAQIITRFDHHLAHTPMDLLRDEWRVREVDITIRSVLSDPQAADPGQDGPAI